MAAPARTALLSARRIVVKLGSAVVTRSDGAGIALGRTANIVDQVSHLCASGREVVVISSGAVAAGRQVLRSQRARRRIVGEVPLPIPSRPIGRLDVPDAADDAADGAAPSPAVLAAVGQSELMALYDRMFKVYGVRCAQVLVALGDVQQRARRLAACGTIDALCRGGMVPIVNQNDAVPEPEGGTAGADIDLPIFDNDSISAALACELRADALLLLSNVDGVYSGDPGLPGSTLLDTVAPDEVERLSFGARSVSGRGGMDSKVDAATFATQRGVRVVIGNGMQWRSVLDMVEGKPVGTLFTTA